MRFELPKDPKEAQDKYQAAMEELNIVKSELQRERDSNKFYETAFDQLPNPVFIKDEDLDFVLFNKEYEKLFGMDKKKYISRNVLDLEFLPLEDRIKYQEEDRELVETTTSINYDQDYLFTDGNIHPCLYWSKGFEVPGTGERGLVGEIVDISKERDLERRLSDSLSQLKVEKEKVEKASRIDPGTSLYNRYVFDDLTKELIEEAVNEDKDLCAIMADLDHFKRVNDTFGHLEGDKVLRDFAKLIRGNIRSGDVPIRYGGEEFLVFLKGADIDVGKEVAERIRQETINKLILPNGENMTVSIGLVSYNKKETRTECISRVDEALYTAKNTGRNKVVVFDENGNVI